MNLISRLVGHVSILVSSLLLISEIIFLINMLISIPKRALHFTKELCICLAIIAVCLMILFAVISLFAKPNLQKESPIWYRILETICIITFVLFFVLFSLKSRYLERGSDVYMSMMFPAFLPLLASITNLISKSLL